MNPSLTILENVPLAPYTTFHIGGPAQYFVTVTSLDELRDAVRFAREKMLQVTVIAGGSNMLISDAGVPGLTIRMAMGGFAIEPSGEYEATVRANAGASLDDMISTCVDRGYWGLENLSGIPGSVGATPIQNVGAYGVEVMSRITAVTALDTESGAIRTFSNEECAFGYRTSFFKTHEGAKYIITEVAFSLTKIPTPHIQYADLRRAFSDQDPSARQIRNEVIRIRSRKFPDWRVVGTAGSFFKNPRISRLRYEELKKTYPDAPGFEEGPGIMKVPLGWILDKVLNLRGARDGAVGTYENQSLVIVNWGGATAHDVDAFATMIETRVKETMQIDIEREVRMYPSV
jgi:UDP-N-acetylmuramate dehydrogenase